VLKYLTTSAKNAFPEAAEDAAGKAESLPTISVKSLIAAKNPA
jgi:hypothetical protein